MVIRKRKQIRLRKYDYSNAGWYFVTICTQNRECLFGNIVNDKMILNEYGLIVNKYWLMIPNHFNNVELDEFCQHCGTNHWLLQISINKKY